MPQAERIELQDPSGSVMADLQAGLATLGPKWGLRQLVDIDGRAGARRPRAALGGGALDRRAGRRGGDRAPVPEAEVEQGENAAAQFLIRWRGEADPRHVEAVDTYWVSAAEHGLNASTFTRADRGLDRRRLRRCAVLGRRRALGPAARRRADARAARCSTRSRRGGDADAYVRGLLDRGERIMGFGHRVYRAEDPRARVLRRTARELGSTRVEVAEELEQAALAALREKSPDRVARDERRVLGRRRARDRRDPAADVPGDVRLRPRRRLVGAHRRAAAHRAADPARRRATSARRRTRWRT